MEHEHMAKKRYIASHGEKSSPAEGESTGPRSKDVYTTRYRSGRVPLVSIQPPVPAMLNFAAALF